MDLPAPLLVFAQTTSLTLDVEAWSAQAERFFSTKLGRLNEEDRVLVAEKGQPATPIRVRASLRNDADLFEAERAEAADPRRSSGLSLLARRCSTVLRVVRIDAGDPASARAELLLAAILSSVLLGPVVDLGKPAIFGVRGARERLTPSS
jgi:hypothetical protein